MKTKQAIPGKLLRIFAAVLVAGHAFLTLSIPQSAKAFSGLGAGTSENPYRITACSQLAEMDTSNNSFVLSADIDCQGVTVNPISVFSGIFDGRNHTITNMTITSTGDNVGLFNWLNSATVRNLKITDASVTGRNYVGILASQVNANTLISHVSTQGAISGQIVVGGVVGLLAGDADLQYSSYTGTVVASNIYGGGLAGMVDSANIENSYAQVDVDGGQRIGAGVGGFIASTSTSSFTKSYVSGNVHNATNRGGLIGTIGGNSTKTISDNMVAVNANGGSALYALTDTNAAARGCLAPTPPSWP